MVGVLVPLKEAERVMALPFVFTAGSWGPGREVQARLNTSLLDSKGFFENPQCLHNRQLNPRQHTGRGESMLSGTDCCVGSPKHLH